MMIVMDECCLKLLLSAGNPSTSNGDLHVGSNGDKHFIDKSCLYSLAF